MNSFIKKYSNHLVLCEIVCAVLLATFISFLSYFLFLTIPIENFLLSQKKYDVIKNNLWKTQQEKKSEINTARALATWQKNHPRFYQAIQQSSHLEITEQLATLFLQSPLKILNMTRDHETNSITVKASGNFLSIFNLLKKLNHSALPLTIENIAIAHTNQITMRFLFAGSYEKK